MLLHSGQLIVRLLHQASSIVGKRILLCEILDHSDTRSVIVGNALRFRPFLVRDLVHIPLD